MDMDSPTKDRKQKRKIRQATQKQQNKANEKPAAGPKVPTVEELQMSLAQLADMNVRLQAELQNTQRRAALDMEKVRKFALVPFATALLETVDNLEKALASFEGQAGKDSLYDGVKLTYQSLIETLKKFNIIAIDPVGEPFNPEFHEALGRVKTGEHKPNTVVTVVEKGYLLNDRLLRAAKAFIADEMDESLKKI